jgi:hypothetical protein
MGLDDLLAAPHAIATHQAAGRSTIVSCADITRLARQRRCRTVNDSGREPRGRD